MSSRPNTAKPILENSIKPKTISNRLETFQKIYGPVVKASSKSSYLQVKQ